MKKQQAQKPKAAKARKPAGVPPVSIGTTTPICGGRAAFDATAGTIDRRYRGWLCKPDGTRVERIIVASIAEAEARAKQLLDKGAI